MKISKIPILKPFFSRSFLTFFLVGICGYLTSLSILVFLKEVCSFHYIIAWQIAWFLTNFLTFYFNKYYSFKSKKPFWKELWRYYLVNSSNLLIAMISVYILVDGLKIWYVTASVIASFILMFYSYVLHRFWSFK